MNSEINEKIAQAQQGSARLHKIEAILRQLESEQENLRRKERELRVVLEKERYDLEKFEHTSIASVFYTILGSLEEHVEKERKEALAAKLRYDQVVKDLRDVQEKISELSTERLSYVDCQREYDFLCAQKKEELMQEKGETAQKILELTGQVTLSRIALQEISEAISAGTKVLTCLNKALSSLESAEGWGTWDLLGGGLLTDLAKHSHIDKAKEEAEKVQRLLRQFKAELTDIRISSDIVLETDGFGKFADFFFDGLIADWFMQSRIQESLASVEDVKSQVNRVMNKLEQMKNQEDRKLVRLEAEIRELIVKG